MVSTLADTVPGHDPIVREQRKFKSHDGTELAYRAWIPSGGTAGTVGGVAVTKGVLLIPGGQEHSGRMREVVTGLGLVDQDVAMFAWDARGQGESPGERGWAPDLGTMVKDLQSFADHIRATYGIATEDLAILAQSIGGVIAAAWVHDYGAPVRGMVLVAPAFRVKYHVPLARQMMCFGQKMKGPKSKNFVKSYVCGAMLSHDPEQAKAYDTDPLISRQVAVNILTDVHEMSTRLIADAGAITTPTLVLAAGSDKVVRNAPMREFVARLGSPIKDMTVFPAMYHGVLNEISRDKPLAQAKAFLQMVLALEPRKQTHLREAYTRAVFDRLSAPLPMSEPRAWSFAFQRFLLHTLGQLSNGIALGTKLGFESGESLDYVYENEPRGKLIVGKWIDRFFLNMVGWQGCRQRRANLRAILAEAIHWLRADGKAVHVLDIASGPGRYLLETLAAHDGVDAAKFRATLRDCSESGLVQGRLLAKQLGVAAIFEVGDAFHEEDLASLGQRDSRPSIAIASGIYENFDDNVMIAASLRGLHRALVPGGYIIYTNQMWNPQAERIARVLVNRAGKPWVMRLRTQAEADRLVREAGFEKVDMKIDRWGIFGVSVAKRKGCGETQRGS